MANVKISGLTAYTDPVATDVLPIVDLVNDQTKKVKVEDLLKKFGLGTEALPSFAFTGDLDTGIYSPGANQFAVTTGGTQRLLIDASGNTTIQGDLTVNGTTTTVSSNTLSIKDKNIEIAVVSTPTDTTADGGGITLKGATDKTLTWVNSTDCWTFNQALNLTTGTAGAPALVFNGDVNSGLFQPGADSLAIATGGAQRVTVDSSGRLLMGTSSAVLDTSNALVQLAASAGANMVLYRDNSSVSNADSLGLIRFYSNAGSSKQEHGRITCIADGASGANDKPGALLFYTTADGASSPTERFRVDSSGRMLLGTTNAVAFGSRQVLAVANGTTGGVISLYNSTTATANTRISSNPTGSEINDIGIHAASTNGSIIAYTNNDTERLRIDSSGRLLLNGGSDVRMELGTNGTTGTNDRNHIRADGDNLKYNTCDNGQHIFEENGTERFRVDSSGSLLLGTTAGFVSGYQMSVAMPGGGGIVLKMGGNSTRTALAFHNPSGSFVGSVTCTTTATTYTTTSDYRLKENVVNIADGITRVKQLQPKRFNFIADNTTTVDGFLAHEAQTVVPEAVTGEKDGEDMQGIDQSKLVPLLTAALQEAISEIETLKQRLSDAGIE